MPDFPTNVEFSERGKGQALLLLPGSFATGAAWKAVADSLGMGYRLVTTSLLGYGATSERRPPGIATMQHQTEIIDLILERIGEPTHIVAHSFGGVAALAHAIQGTIKPASLTLIEANPLGTLRSAGETGFYAMFGAMTKVYIADYNAGKSDAARHVIDFFGGEGTFASLPAKVREYVIKTAPNNIRDWSSTTGFEPPLFSYQQIAASTLVIRGGNSHPAMKRIAEILATTIPPARLETVRGGGHFLLATHPTELACLIDAHVARNGSP